MIGERLGMPRHRVWIFCRKSSFLEEVKLKESWRCLTAAVLVAVIVPYRIFPASSEGQHARIGEMKDGLLRYLGARRRELTDSPGGLICTPCCSEIVVAVALVPR